MKHTNQLPDFLIIGAPKCGTTSVSHYLRQHPQVFMPAVKEPHFFLFDGPNKLVPKDPKDAVRARELIQDWDTYRALFAPAHPGAVKGEASVRYLYFDQARKAIMRRLPNVKLIVVLRQPAERAFSNYQRDRFQGNESFDSFAKALDDGPRREAEGLLTGTFEKLGYYARFLKPYLDSFPRQQIKIYLLEDLQADGQAVMRDLYQFLEVDPEFVPNLNVRFNETGIIANPVWRFIWHRTRNLRSHILPIVPMSWRGKTFRKIAGLRVKKTEKHSIDPILRAQLNERYREDILRLQELIERDLTHWLETS